MGYDEENNTFIIVEYKNIKTISLVDQGYAYLGMMLKEKKPILKYNNVNQKEWKRNKRYRLVTIKNCFALLYSAKDK